MDSILEASALERHVGRRRLLGPALSFSLTEGEHLAVMGPSGSGKTTLIRLLAGLIEPTRGEVREAGRVVNRPGSAVPPHTRDLGVLFQELALWPHLTACAQVEMALPRLRGGRARRARALEALARVGLADRAGCYPAELSGGERQRVAWARAVAGAPRLLLLDEPLTSLDPQLREELLAATIEYGRAPGRTMVIVTHDRRVAERAGRRVLELGASVC